MKHSQIEAALHPLIEHANDKKWLTKLFAHPATFELYAALASEVYLKHPEHGASVMVTSAVGGEGRTSIATLFAALAAATDVDRQVLLVDADFSHGSLAGALNIEQSHPGLSEYFDGTVTADQCLAPTALNNLLLAPVAAGEPSRVLPAPAKFEQFMKFAEQRFDLVVVDGPAGSANKDVLSIAKSVQHTVVVVRYGFSAREQLSALAADLERIDAPILGTIMNRREYVLPRFVYGN